MYWFTWCLAHSLLASGWIKARMQHVLGRNYRFYRLGYSMIAAATFAWLLVYHFSGRSFYLFQPGKLIWVAAPFCLLGAALMGVCIRKYFFYLSGVDVFLAEHPVSVLQTGGLHRYVRHPLYASTLLFAWSLFLMFPLLSNLVACAVITGYTLVGIRIEEKKLLKEYGEAYRAYASAVPMILPFTRRSATHGRAV